MSSSTATITALFRHRLFHAGGWQLMAGILGRAPLLVSSVVLAQCMGRSTLGLFGGVMTTLSLVSTLLSYSIASAVTKYLGEFRRQAPDRAGRLVAIAMVVSLSLGGLGCATLYTAAPWISVSFFLNVDAVLLLRLGAVLLLLQSVQAVQFGILSGIEFSRAIANTNLVVGALGVVGVTFAASVGGATGVISLFVVTTALSVWISQWAIRLRCRELNLTLSLKDARCEFTTLLRFGVPMFACGVVVVVVDWLIMTQLLRCDGGGQAGVFVAATNWMVVIAYIPNQLGNAVIPHFSEQLAIGNLTSARHILRSLLFAYLIVLGGMAVVGMALAPMVAELYGPEFRQEWQVFALSFLASLAIVCLKPAENVLTAAGMIWGIGVGVGAFALLYLGLASVFREQGAWGVALARAVAYLALAVLYHLIARHRLTYGGVHAHPA